MLQKIKLLFNNFNKKDLKIIILAIIAFIILFFNAGSVYGASGDYIFNGETVPAKSWRTDSFYGVDTIRNVLDALEISYTDTTLVAYTHYANKFMKFYRATYDENATALNMCIAKTSSGTATTFAIIPSNGSFSDSLPYAYVNEKASTGSYVGVNAFVNWNYNTTTGAISGANNANIAYATISTTNYTIGNSRVNVYTTTEDYQQEGNLYYKNLLSPIRTFAVAGNTNETGYSWYFLTNTIEFSATAGEDESGDTGGGNGGGTGGNVDLTMTNQKIDELNRHAEEIKNKIPTSGDIQQATTSGVVQGNTEYWGSSGDLSGEQQENIFSGEISNLIETLSGDMGENEIFGILKKYEDKIFGSFTGEEDFKISWNNIMYAGEILIPSGEVNFSEMCRENEALGRVKTTINILLDFFLLSNCVIYLYNLLLASLGIDNPYLYETPPEEVHSVTYDTDLKTGKTTEIRTTRKRDGTTFRQRRKL